MRKKSRDPKQSNFVQYTLKKRPRWATEGDKISLKVQSDESLEGMWQKKGNRQWKLVRNHVEALAGQQPDKGPSSISGERGVAWLKGIALATRDPVLVETVSILRAMGLELPKGNSKPLTYAATHNGHHDIGALLFRIGQLVQDGYGVGKALCVMAARTGFYRNPNTTFDAAVKYLKEKYEKWCDAHKLLGKYRKNGENKENVLKELGEIPMDPFFGTVGFIKVRPTIKKIDNEAPNNPFSETFEPFSPDGELVPHSTLVRRWLAEGYLERI